MLKSLHTPACVISTYTRLDWDAEFQKGAITWMWSHDTDTEGTENKTSLTQSSHSKLLHTDYPCFRH